MQKNNLMQVYDKAYDETFREIMTRTSNREEAKRIIGLIYREAWQRLHSKFSTIKDALAAFEASKAHYGIAAMA